MDRIDGKVAVVTGANGGMGRVTALELAKRGATVVMICRSKERGEAARKEIATASGNPNVELVLADLSSMTQVRQAAEAIKAKHPRLHILVNNAAVFLPTREVTEDGLEKTFATNYLSHFLLTNLLLENLKAAGAARIVNVSTLPRGLKINLDDLQLEKTKYSVFGAVGPSKLAQLLMTAELARRLQGTQVTVNALHPGVVKTELLDQMGWLMRTVFNLMSTTPEKGASTAIFLATSPSVDGLSGKLFANSKEVPMGPKVDPETAKKLWEISARLAKLEGVSKAA